MGQHRSAPITRIASVAAVVIVAAAMVSLAAVNWPAHDDLCIAGIALEHGFAGAMSWLFHEWSGRFATSALLFAVLAGVDLPQLRWLSMALAAGFVWVAWNVARLLAPDDGELRLPLFAVVLAALSVGLYGLMGQTVFWPTGGVVYLLPLVLVLAWLQGVRGRLAVGPERPVRAASGFLLGLLVGNSIELVLAIVFTWLALVVPRRWKFLPPAARSGIAWRVRGLVVGSLLLVLAPGNYYRASVTPGSLRTDPAYLASSYARILGEIHAATRPMLYVLAAALLGWLLVRRLGPAAAAPAGAPSPVPPVRGTLGNVVPTYESLAFAAGALASIVPVLAAPAQSAPRNGLFLLVFALIGALLPPVERLRRADPARRRPVLAAVAILALATSLYASLALLADAKLAGAIRREQVARHAELREAARAGRSDATVSRITLPVPPTLHFVDLAVDRDNWTNQCTAKYYGLKSVRVPRPS